MKLSLYGVFAIVVPRSKKKAIVLFLEELFTVPRFGPKTLSISNELISILGHDFAKINAILTCCFRRPRKVCPTLKNLRYRLRITKLKVNLSRRHERQSVTQLLMCSVTIMNLPPPSINLVKFPKQNGMRRTNCATFRSMTIHSGLALSMDSTMTGKPDLRASS